MSTTERKLDGGDGGERPPMEETLGSTKKGLNAEDSRLDRTYWSFTWFPEDGGKEVAINKIGDLLTNSWKNVKWIVMQWEQTKDDRKHLQGAIGFTKTCKAFPGLRKAMPGCHVEPTRDWRNSQSYCCKTDSRLPGSEPYYYGVTSDEIKPWGTVEPHTVRGRPPKGMEGDWRKGWEILKELGCTVNIYDKRIVDDKGHQVMAGLGTKRSRLNIVDKMARLPTPHESTKPDVKN